MKYIMLILAIVAVFGCSKAPETAKREALEKVLRQKGGSLDYNEIVKSRAAEEAAKSKK